MTPRAIAFLLLASWLLVGMSFTLFPGDPAPGQVVRDNLVPLRTIGIYLDNLDSAFWMVQLFGNLLLFLPLGLLGPLALPLMDRWSRILSAALLMSLAVEVAQLWIPDRAADVDDLLINVLGAGLGYALFRAWRLGSDSGSSGPLVEGGD